MHIDVFLRTVISERASDLYLSAGLPPRLRIDGIVRPMRTAPLDGGTIRSLVEPLLSDHTRREWETERKLSVDFGHDAGELGRFRVNYFVQQGSPAAVLRAIPREIPTAEQLGLPEEVAKLAHLRSGLVFITGATGSGKTTTLGALQDKMNRERPGHVVTIEDPIEFQFESRMALFTQREIGRDVDSFPAALRDALRQALDVIVVGEIRDEDTLLLSLQAAETGHLVLGTLHTNSAVKSINRVVGMVSAERQKQVRHQLAETLRAVVAQRLVPRADGRGRVATFEILLNKGGVATAIENAQLSEISAQMENLETGMQTLEYCLAGLVARGLVSEATAREQANDLQLLERKLRSAGLSATTGAGVYA